MELDSFGEKVRQWWESYHFDGDPNFVLANNLRALKEDPKKSLAMLELEKKKTCAENSGAKSREELVFYLLRLDAEEKRKEKNQQNLC